MTAKSQFDQYLVQADAVQKEAERAKNPEAEQARAQIAAKYRDLAMVAQ